jgi:hypothetical protein
MGAESVIKIDKRRQRKDNRGRERVGMHTTDERSKCRTANRNRQ